MAKYDYTDLNNKKDINGRTNGNMQEENKAEDVSEQSLPARKKKCWRIILPIVAVILLAATIIFCYRNDLTYAYAEWRFNSDDFTAAKEIFKGLNGFKDSQKYLTDIYYVDACSYMESGEYQNAIELFSSIKGYTDSAALLNECYKLWADVYFAECDYKNATVYYSLSSDKEGIRRTDISWGDQLYAQNNFIGAIGKWQPYAGDEEIATKISHADYELANIAAAAGNDYNAVIKLNNLNYDNRAHEAADALLYMNPEYTDTLAVSDNHIVYITSDGSVHSDGNNSHGQGDVSKWAGVVSLCASKLNTYGLTYNGMVLAAGSDAFGQCGVSDWTDIIDICATDNAVFGLKHDGTVVFSGGETNQYKGVLDWTNITKLSAGKDHIAAIDKSGATYAAGNNEYGQCKAAGVINTDSVICGPYRTILISKDGKVSIYGSCTRELKRSISSWTNIKNVSSSYCHIVAQDSSGNLLAAGENGRGQCIVSEWKDVNHFYACADFTLAVKSDGSVVTSVAGHTLDWNILLWK